MFRILFLTISFFIAAIFSVSTSATAGLIGASDFVNAGKTSAGFIKVHTSRQVHDKLHRAGYYRVYHIDTRYDEYDKPVYKFRACKRNQKYNVKVDWYGDVISRTEIGECGYRRYRRREYSDDY